MIPKKNAEQLREFEWENQFSKRNIILKTPTDTPTTPRSRFSGHFPLPDYLSIAHSFFHFFCPPRSPPLSPPLSFFLSFSLSLSLSIARLKTVYLHFLSPKDESASVASSWRIYRELFATNKKKSWATTWVSTTNPTESMVVEQRH